MTKSIFNKMYLKKQLCGIHMKEGTTVLEHLNFFNKVISKLPAADVKIDEEDKALILLSSLPQSYDHIITTILYGNETLILEEVTPTLLFNEIRKRPNQEKQEVGFGGHVKERKKRRNEKSELVEGISLLSQKMSVEE